MVTVNELLRPLFNRLHTIEKKEVSIYEADIRANSEAIISRIEKDLFSVDRQELIADLNIGLNRVLSIVKNGISFTDNSDQDDTPFANDNDVNVQVTEELSCYYNGIKKWLKQLNTELPKSDSGGVFQLPQNFKASDLTKEGFRPLLSEREATIFLYLLRENKFLPAYTNDSLSTLAAILLGRGKQGVRERLGLLQSEVRESANQESIRNLKHKIELLIECLDSLLVDSQ